MHVSLSGGSEGVSFTIETHGASQKNQDTSHTSNVPQERRYEDSVAQIWNNPGPPYSNMSVDQAQASTQRRHHQQSRTIFRCVSNESLDRESPSRSSIASPFSDISQEQIFPQDFNQHQESERTSLPFSPGAASRQEEGIQRAKVWKLSETPATSPLALCTQSNGFTLQETLFVEQLTAIEERVRCQVPMEASQVRSFFNCALNGSPISQTTIMHAYQTCIKRIVRFANSLQDFVELPPDDMQKLLVSNTVSIINIRIARWFHPKTNLKTQITLCGTGQDLFKDALQEGKLSEGTALKVGYDDVFSSPWCCDSSHEDRYEALIQQIHQLDLDSTVVVLLSVMCLFDSEQVEDLSAKPTIISHGRKFSLLLQRYLVESIGKEKTAECFIKYREALQKLREMAEILINKRLIC